MFTASVFTHRERSYSRRRIVTHREAFLLTAKDVKSYGRIFNPSEECLLTWKDVPVAVSDFVGVLLSHTGEPELPVWQCLRSKGGGGHFRITVTLLKY